MSNYKPNLNLKGMNGWHDILYQHYWDWMEDDVCGIRLHILINNGESVKPLNKNWVALIPKVKKPKRLVDFKPITLYNVIYKFISNVFGNRLKKYHFSRPIYFRPW